MRVWIEVTQNYDCLRDEPGFPSSLWILTSTPSNLITPSSNRAMVGLLSPRWELLVESVFIQQTGRDVQRKWMEPIYTGPAGVGERGKMNPPCFGRAVGPAESPHSISDCWRKFEFQIFTCQLPLFGFKQDLGIRYDFEHSHRLSSLNHPLV